EDPAIMLYTSATGNTPVCGIVLPHQAIVSQKITAHWVLDLRSGDCFWCTADPGWITGIAYGILGSLANGTTNILYQPRFDAKGWYQILKEEAVNVWYTAPTALRFLRGSKLKPPKLENLRHICSVGEALEPELISWSKKNLNLPIYDTYWLTETGSMMMVNYRAVPIKPGSMGKPVPGIKAAILDKKNRPLSANQEGDLAFWRGWPSQLITVWKNPTSFQRYFRGQWFITGDRAYKDKDGYFYFVGRADDVLKTSGERVGPFSVESTLVSHPSVLETGVIGKPDKLRGEIIKAFVVLKEGVAASDKLKEELVLHVKKNLAYHAYPKEIEFVKSLPKNRSGKIIRRILKARELGLPLGDTSTLIKD
ncbi:AMP-binding protein, partial [Patescibacteria group bacterium]|nr:AMP-binding protein [Patescibacteria group bacterium]